MMNDPLKHFIRDNRKAFDDEMPGHEVWSSIHRQISKQKNAKRFTLYDIYKWSAVAAILCVALTCTYFFWIKNNNPARQQQAEATRQQQQKTADIDALAPEFAARFRQMYRSIEEQQAALKTAATGEPELYRQFATDLALLDSTYAALKEKLKQSPNEERVISAMLYNLQLQAELLQKQQQILSEYNNTKKISHEKNNHSDI
ncbi:MAG TPA: hypothetical protein PKC69_14105 [Chitinophagaceae bacterium]|nr:hypothetical protein [Chitinophagaceae bacterium]